MERSPVPPHQTVLAVLPHTAFDRLDGRTACFSATATVDFGLELLFAIGDPAYKRPSSLKRFRISMIRRSPARREAGLVCTE